MIQRVSILQHELGLVFQRGDFRGVLEPGVHWVFGLRSVTVVNRLESRFEHPWLEVLVKHPALTPYLEVVQLAENQRAMVWRDERLLALLEPGLYAFWRSPVDLRVEEFTLESARLVHPQLHAVLKLPLRLKSVRLLDVEPHEVALIYQDGELTEVAQPGRHAFWATYRSLTWQSVDLREQVLDVSGQEIMTADKVTLRLNLVVAYQVVDAVRFANVSQDAAQALYREAQLALRVALGQRKLDELLSDKESVGEQILGALALRAEHLGLAVRTVGLRDVILPGEMKQILNQVIEAQKRAEAQLIQRREVTAAARSQANTARLLADNPALARMKELEALQGILAGAQTTFVVGPQDVLSQLSHLTGPQIPRPKA